MSQIVTAAKCLSETSHTLATVVITWHSAVAGVQSTSLPGFIILFGSNNFFMPFMNSISCADLE